MPRRVVFERRKGADYESAQRAPTREIGRDTFLDVARKARPSILTTLWKVAHARSRDALVTRLDEPSSDWPPNLLEAWLEQRQELDDALLAWGTSWALTDDWILDRAGATVLAWLRAPSVFRKPRWQFGATITWAMGRAPFGFEHEGWDPSMDARVEVEAEMRQAFQGALRRYLRKREQDARAEGLRRAPGLREAPAHVRWLAHYQVAGRSMEEIARHVHRDRTTVRDAIHWMARFLGLTLRRPTTAGRPRRRATRARQTK